MQGVSVIICCFNSEYRLPQTLKCLSLQKVPETIAWEIIVVDNASVDNTAEIADQILRQFNLTNFGFKVLGQPQPGKNFALDLGINNASFDYILICDDDNWLNEDYIAIACDLLQSENEIGAAGGQGIAVTDGDLPNWFESCQHAYAVGKQNAETGDISQKKYLWGAGMIFRKTLYNQAYSTPSFLTGPKAETVSRGEDVEFCMRILLLGYALYYDGKLIFRHYLPQNRLTIAYRDKLLKGYEYETRILNLYSKLISIGKLSLLNKIYTGIASVVRFGLGKTGITKKWNTGYESETIYLMTGLQLQQIQSEVKGIKHICDQLLAYNKTYARHI